MKDYKQKYEEAFERAKSLIDFCSDSELKTLEHVFPELKESEDERIRKALIFHYQGDGCLCTNEYRIDYKDICAWLEKQGEQKEATCVAEIIDHLTEKEQEILFKELEMQKVQKPVWSEEDSLQLDAAINIVTNSGHTCTSDWLKSLKNRVAPQQAMWSEEDKEVINTIISLLEEFSSKDYVTRMNCISWLKSLRPQNTWKPSDEQIEVLN